MRLSKLSIVVATLAIFSFGCGKPGYNVGFTGIKFYRKDFNGRMVSHKLTDADKASFEILNDVYAKDKKSVYFRGRAIPQCDPATLKLLGEKNLYCRDGSHVFLETKVVSQEPDSFEFVGGGYSRDTNTVYFLGEALVGASAAEWQSVTGAGPFGKDTERAFFEGKPLEGEVELQLFEPLNYSYSRDSSRVWYRDKLIESADAESFTVESQTSRKASDKNATYDQGVKT